MPRIKRDRSVQILELRNKQDASRILRLIDSLRRLQVALAIEDPRARDEEILRNVTSLTKNIEDSYEWLVGTASERAHQLLEVLEPLSTHSKIYETIKSTLRCIGKSREILGKITKKDEAVYELDRLYVNFRNSTKLLADRSLARVRPYLKTATLDFLASSLVNEVVGDLLERFYAPELVKRMGYQLKPRVVPTSIGEVQVDVRGEKDEISGFENLERHLKRKVLIVETKTSVKSEHIRELSKKHKAILNNYQRESEIWKYRFTLETWLIACYRWDERLKDYAQRQNIIPIDSEELRLRLREYNLLDRSRPPCPKLPRKNPR